MYNVRNHTPANTWLLSFRWQLTFSLWCLWASLLNRYGGPSRWWPSFSSSTQAMFCWCFQITWSIFTVHYRCCCPLCDFLLPPLHDHRECRPLISGPQNVKNTGISSHYKISRCTFMVSLATWLGWALQWSKLCQTMCLPGDQKANNHIHRVRWATP